MMKRLLLCLTGLALALGLTGCSAAAFWLSGCGDMDADLVICNDSRWEVWSIELDYGNETQGVRNARDHALLERGQSYGLELDGEHVTVVLSGQFREELARAEMDFTGERLYLTLEEDRTLSESKEWPNG